jgi:hypothetical protein
MSIVLILGSGPNAMDAADWPRDPFDSIVAINNAWQVRPDWDLAIHPWDFPENRRPTPGPGQRLVTQDDFVPAQNDYGGFVYAGATMAFTAAYWVLHALRPKVIAMMGCDMVYPARGKTHFYGTGSPDPLRQDITLQSLEAKSARLRILAARQDCAVVNLSQGPSRLVMPKLRLAALAGAAPLPFDKCAAQKALGMERTLKYQVPSGRYWEELSRFDPAQLRRLDGLWLQADQLSIARSA